MLLFQIDMFLKSEKSSTKTALVMLSCALRSKVDHFKLENSLVVPILCLN